MLFRQLPTAGFPEMPPQRLGQNFLTDGSVAGRIFRSAKVSSSTFVLEVGPGRGALTFQLATAAAHLTVIEFDHDLAEVLRQRFADSATVDVIEADARLVDPAALPHIGDRPYVFVANLPYYAANPIMRNFLESSHPPESMVVMVQREVARDMLAAPGEMSMLSLAIQVYAEGEILFDVPPSAFTPRPKIHSSVLRLKPRQHPLVNAEKRDDFFRVCKAGFKAPRKQLHNSLGRGLNIDVPLARSIIESAGVDSGRRPATLSIDEWKAVLAAWYEAGKPFVVHGTSRSEREQALSQG